MTKRILALLVILACSLTARAQWSKVDNYVNDGRPASALDEARRLLASARTPGERMQAMLAVGQLQQEITPDSFFATIRAIDNWHRTAKRPDERAVTAIVLARLLEANSWRLPHAAEAPAFSADDYRRAAYSQPFDSLHAVKAKEWEPFIELEAEGRDVLASRWWKEDLLHVILSDAPDSIWARARQFYATVGCSEPQIEEYIRRCRDSIDVCREGMRIYKDEKRAAVLQNELMRIECPKFSAQNFEAFYPAREYTLNFKAKNVSAYTIHTYRLNSEPQRWNVATIRSAGKRIGETSHTISESPCPASLSQIYTTPATPGLYALVITPTPTRETKKVEPLVMPMRVSPYQLLELEQPDGTSRFVVTDALSGKPVEGVKVKVDRGRASIEGDAQQPFYFHHIDSYRPDTITRNTHSLFADRAIYRPGQTVQMSLVAYASQGKSAQVLKDKEIVVRWHTAKHEQIQVDTVKTDAFGTATASLALPVDAGLGVWTIQSQHGHASFRVEEYKRPTFAIEMEQVDTPLVVRVAAKNFNGVPLRGARVAGHYRIEQPWWWRSFTALGNAGMLEHIDTLATDAQGHANISIPLPKNETHFAQLVVNVDVTSATGETHSHELRLPLRRDELAIQATVPEMVERSRITPWDVKLVDATGRAVPGEIMCTVANRETLFPAVSLPGLPQLLATLPTARYRITFAHGDIKSEGHIFSLFSVDDKFTPDTAHFFATADTLPCRLHIGTCLDDVTLFVNACDGKEVVWDKQIVLNKEAMTLDLAPATHSDGISVSFAFVKDETVETWTKTFTNPRPDKRLRWHWNTFRDRTAPGSHEQWSGTLLRPDGTPAPANVMLTIYDAALNALVPHNWQLAFQPRIQTARSSWFDHSRDIGWWTSAVFTLPLLREPELLHHHFSYKYLTGGRFTGTRMYKSNMLMAASVTSVRREMAAGKQLAATEECCDEAAVLGAADDLDASEPRDLETQLRCDFSEQAVFAPALRTDNEGRFTLDFTLPQSVTTWQLLGVAHTEDMMTATTRQQCVAQKEVMVQLGVPRFLRLGDEATITATVTNLTPESLPATLTIYTPNRLTFSLSLSANSDTTITVPFVATSLDEIVVRATVSVAQHSDGEQRMIPVIDSRSWTTETIDLATLGSKTVEVKQQSGEATITFNPAPVWTAVSALPAMMAPDENDAFSLSNAYFATTLTHHLATVVPQIQERRQFALDSLKQATECWHRTLERLQHKDGSFAWFAGGNSSPFITTEICVELARLIQLTGHRSPLLDKAMEYLSKEVDKEIAWNKKHNVKAVSSNTLYYLYASALMGSQAKQSDYLLPIVAKELTRYDMNTRAIAAIIFKHYGRDKEARRFITSLNEHIVTTPERGSYFDYPSGPFTSINRKLQTLTTAIEAKTVLRDTVHLQGLRRNLLQQRRVQGWDSKLFATAAVSAVLGSSPTWEGSVTLSIDQTQHTINCDTTIVLSSVPKQLRVSDCKHEAWGALFIKRLLPNDSVEASGTGMTLRHELASEMRVGDRITQRCMMTVDRDYEWVRLSVPRPAGLEPAEQISGYRHQAGLSYYLSQHDNREDYFFEHIPRGTYIIESQMLADRAGTYQSGVASIECLYAPEFRAHTMQSSVTIKN